MSRLGEPAQPERCDQEVFDKGDAIAVISGPRSFTLEEWIGLVREEAGFKKIDWNFVGGRAVVRALGNKYRIGRAKAAIEKLMPTLVKMYLECPHNFINNPEARHVQWRWL